MQKHKILNEDGQSPRVKQKSISFLGIKSVKTVSESQLEVVNLMVMFLLGKLICWRWRGSSIPCNTKQNEVSITVSLITFEDINEGEGGPCLATTKRN